MKKLETIGICDIDFYTRFSDDELLKETVLNIADRCNIYISKYESSKDSRTSYIFAEDKETKKIAYIEYGSCSYGMKASTIHKPNSLCGTGFGTNVVNRGTPLSYDEVCEAFVDVPPGYGGGYNVKKFKDFNEYMECAIVSPTFYKVEV